MAALASTVVTLTVATSPAAAAAQATAVEDGIRRTSMALTGAEMTVQCIAEAVSICSVTRGLGIEAGGLVALALTVEALRATALSETELTLETGPEGETGGTSPKIRSIAEARMKLDMTRNWGEYWSKRRGTTAVLVEGSGAVAEEEAWCRGCCGNDGQRIWKIQ